VPVPIPVLQSRLLAAAVACLLAASVIGLAVVSEERGRAAEALSEVRSFLKDKRTATFTSTSSWTGTALAQAGGRGGKAGRGEVRLPNEAHAVTVREGDGVEEVVVHVDSRFRRTADQEADLAKDPWEPLPTNAQQADDGWSEQQRVVMDIIDYGVPVNLDALLAGLPRAVRTGPGLVRGSYALKELLPRSRSADADAERERSSLGGRVDVTVSFGAGGRLDALELALVTDTGAAEFVRTDGFRFSNWGAPVAFTLPDRSDAAGLGGAGLVGGAGGAGGGDDEARNALKQRVAVYEPARLPDGWVATGKSWAADAGQACGYFVVEYGPMPGDPRLALASSSRECPTTPVSTRDIEAARPIQIGEHPGAVIKARGPVGFTQVHGAAIMLDVGATRVFAVSSEGEQFLIDTLHRLRLVDPATV